MMEETANKDSNMAYHDLDYYFGDSEPIKCPACEDLQTDLESAQMHFRKLVEILYKGESINCFELSDVIEELGHSLHEDFDPNHLPPVMRMYSLGQEIYNTTSDKIKEGAI